MPVPGGNAGDANPPFRPAPPADVHLQRRMPDVGDFPPVGQRVYHAKTGGAPSESGARELEAPRKPGLLGRLTSPFSKRRGESDRQPAQGDSQYDINAASPDVTQPTFGSAYGPDGRPSVVPPGLPQKRSG